MNLIAVIILFALLAEYLLGLVLDYLNLKTVQVELPDAFRGVYDPSLYQKSQAYLRVNTVFGRLTSTFSLLVVLGFWFSGGFQIVDSWVRSLSLGPVFTGILYIGVILGVRVALFIPFRIYDTFAIEERFGFNKSDWRTFIKDGLKAVGLSLVLGIPVLSTILLFFEVADSHAWWLCWIAVCAYAFAAQYVVPTWIMPLFNRFEPLEEGELRSAIQNCAEAAGFPLRNVYMMDGSRRSSKANAFFAGFGKHKRIVLFDTLVASHTIPELVGILAHEMGHDLLRHNRQNLLLAWAEMGVMLYLLSLFVSRQALFDAFFVAQPSVYAGLLLFGMLYEPIAFAAGIGVMLMSRKNEYDADRFAVETTGDPSVLSSALKKLSANNLTNLLPHPWYAFFHYTHPPILQRLQAIEGRHNGS